MESNTLKQLPTMRTNRTLLLIMGLMLSFSTMVEAIQYKFFVRFTDKNGSPYSVSNPSAFLSAKAIARRAAQQIPITDIDLPVNQTYINGLTSSGAIVLTRSKWFNGATIQCDSNVLANVLTLPYVLGAKHVERHTSTHITKDEVIAQNTPSLARTMSYDYGGSFNQIHLMNGEYLHNAGYSGEGMVIALLDAGFYAVDQLPAFDSLRTRGGILGTWDFVMNESAVYEDDTHGMEVLSTIAGNIPGELVGTAPHADFWLLRSEDAPIENIIEEYNWDAAAEFADSVGADVISSSLGYSTFDDSSMNHAYSDMDGNTCPASVAADIAVSRGMLVLVSAGNSGGNSWHYISAPSDADSVLAVAAVDEFGNYVGFSSWGPASDGDVKPNVAAKGLYSTLSDWSGMITQGSGTSFACPILAGSATCLWQAHPGASAMEVKRAIEESANYYNTPTDSLGYGIPNFANADFILGVPTIAQNHDVIYSVYPNPLSDQLNIRLYSTTNGPVKTELYNSIGELISSSTESLISGANQVIQIPLNAALADGVYFLKVSTKELSSSLSLVKTGR